MNYNVDKHMEGLREVSRVAGGADFFLTGSMYYNECGNDYDFVCAGLHDLEGRAEAHGWLSCRTQEYHEPDRPFHAFRKGDFNLLLTTTEYYEKWRAAAEVCRWLAKVHGPLPKEQRVAIHRMVMDGGKANDYLPLGI